MGLAHTKVGLEQQPKSWGREDGAQQWKGLNGKLIDFNTNFSQTYSFVYFEIFCVVEETYSENMKPMCRFNQLHKFEGEAPGQGGQARGDRRDDECKAIYFLIFNLPIFTLHNPR